MWAAHFYIIDENAKIVIEGDGDCEIEYDSTTRTYAFVVNKYLDFKIAVNNFLYGLESGNEDLSHFRDIIESKTNAYLNRLKIKISLYYLTT